MKTLSKILSVVLCLAVVMAMFVIGASAASSETLVAANLGLANAAEFTSTQVGIVTFTADAGTNASNSCKYYSTGSGLRWYKDNTLTVSVPAGYKIISIVATASGSSYTLSGTATNATVSESGAVTTITATSETNTITITSSDTCRVQQIVVNYDVEGAAECQHPTTKWDITYGTHKKVCDGGCGATIKNTEGNHDTAGTNGACSVCGYKADLSTPAGIIEAIGKLSGDEIIENVSLTGKVGSFNGYYSAKYSSISIYLNVEGISSYLSCYQVKAAEGTNLDLSKLCLNDTVTIKGNIGLYNGNPEFKSGSVVTSHVAGGTTIPSDPTAVVDALYALEDGKSLPYNYTLTGKVTSIEGNIKIVVDGRTDKPIECFSMSNGDAKKADIKVGDTITVTGVLKNYKGTYEFNKCELNKIVAHTCENSWKVEEGVGHYEECSICGTKTEACTGTVATTYTTDATHHWYACSNTDCGYTVGKAEHTKGTDGKCTACSYNMNCVHEFEPKKDETHHWNECKHCGDIEGGQKVAHTVKYDSNQHWIECSCGTTSEKAYHTLNNNKCDCGYEKVTEGYLKVTNGKLTSGKYVMVLTNGYAPTKMDGTWLLSGTPTIKGNQVTNPEEFVVTLTVEGNKVTIKDANGKIIMNKADNNSLQADATEGAWTWEYKDGYFMFHDGKEEPRYLASNAEQENKFRAYRLNSSQASSQTNTFVMYKLTTSGGNSSTGDNSVVSVAVAAAVLSVMGCAVLVSKRKHF